MKCVESYRIGKQLPVVLRVTDDFASQLVKAETHRYVPKAAWKKQERKEVANVEA